MKKILSVFVALSTLAMFTFTACEKPENDTPNDDNNQVEEPDTPGGEEPDTPSITIAEFQSINFSHEDFATWVVWDDQISLPSGFTYVFWVCPFSLSGQQRIGNFADVADEGQTCINMLRFGENHDGNYDYTELQWWCGGSSRMNVWIPGFSANAWLQVALVCDGTNLKAYVGGELKGENAFSEPISTAFGAIEFANSWGASYRTYFDGSICQISVYDTALSATEISGAKINGLSADLQAKAKAWWPMQEGTGVVCEDKIGNRDINFANTVRNDNDGATEHYTFDASEYIVWMENKVEVL